MKWILYGAGGVLALLLLAIISLLAVGGFRGESRLERSIEIARPAGAVFRWIREPERVKSWLGWLVEIRELTPGRDGVGAREIWVMEDRNNNNQRMDIETEVTRHEPDRLLETRLHARDGFTGVVTYELEPLDARRTRLVYRGDYKYEHWLARLLGPIITRSADQKLVADLERLKQRAEAE